jgi:hypothetical protein
MRSPGLLLIALLLAGCKDREAIALFAEHEPAILVGQQALARVERALPARGAEKASCPASITIPAKGLPLLDEEVFELVLRGNQAPDFSSNPALARSTSRLSSLPGVRWLASTRFDPDFGEANALKEIAEGQRKPEPLIAVMRTTVWDDGEADWNAGRIVRPSRWSAWVFVVRVDSAEVLATVRAEATSPASIETIAIGGTVRPLSSFMPISETVDAAVTKGCPNGA